MTSAEVQAWLTKHGGVDGDPQRSMTGQQIILAKDGSRLVLTRITPDSYRVDDNFEKDAPPGPAASGSAPAPEAQPSSPSQPAASSTSAGGAGMNQQDLEARLAQMGALGAGDFHEETKTEDVPNPKYNPLIPGSPSTLKQVSTYRTWIKPGTNQRLTVRVNADGTYTQTYSGRDDAIKPPTAASGQKPTGSTTNIEGTPDGRGGFDNERPVMVTRGPDGKLISSEPLTPSEMEEWRRNRERSRNPGGKSDAEIQAEKDRNKPGAPVLKPDGKGGTIAVQAMPDGTIKTTDLPGVPSDARTVTIEGIVYEKGADGQYVAVVRGPSQTPGPAGGPRLPKFVYGQLAATLTQYQQDLNNDPSLTSTQRKERMEEALQVSTHVMNEATILQREQESNLNASVNLATNRAKAGQDALTSATNIVNSINDKLPVGSSLGGKAFAAMMGLNLLNQQRSGLNDIVPGRSAQGQQIAAATGSTIAATQANLSRLTAPPAPVAPAIVPPPSDAQAAANAGPVPGQAGTPQTAVTPPSRPVFTPPPALPAVPNFPGGGRDAAGNAPLNPTIQMRNPTTGETRTVLLTETAALASAGWEPVDPNTGRTVPGNPPPALAKPPESPVDTAAIFEPKPQPPLREPPTGSLPWENPANFAPQQPTAPQSGAGNVQMAPPPTFAALAAYQPAPMASPVPAPTMAASPPALLHAKAASRPPWRFSDAEIQEMEQAGVPIDIIQSVPGARVA